MKLIAFRYSEPGWHLNFSQFSDQILLVGQNASGKSKTIAALSMVASLIAQKRNFTASTVFESLLLFDNGGEAISYHFFCKNGTIKKEELLYSPQYSADKEIEIIKRDENQCLLNGEQINPPHDRLVVNVRRDTQLYPEMELLQKWADNVIGFSFNETDMYGDGKTGSWFNGYNHPLTSIIADMDDMPDVKTEYLEQLKQIGYNISEIKALNFGSEKKVYVKEVGVKIPIFDMTMSKGMFRTLYVVAYLLYFKHIKLGQPAMLLIDDLCEGLDYDRSTRLGKFCYSMCEELGIQLMASSNDSFLMDVVDLKYWNILHRNSGNVEVINQNSHPELFDRFEMTGLSNFDLFSSDFIERHTGKSVK